MLSQVCTGFLCGTVRSYAGSFSSKTARIFEQADIANFDGVLRTIDVEVKPEKTTKDDEVIPSVIKTALIGIGQCVVTEDGVPLKLNAMLKWHLLAELKVRHVFTITLHLSHIHTGQALQTVDTNCWVSWYQT